MTLAGRSNRGHPPASAANGVPYFFPDRVTKFVAVVAGGGARLIGNPVDRLLGHVAPMFGLFQCRFGQIVVVLRLCQADFGPNQFGDCADQGTANGR